ncbi:acyltransferase [Rhizorhabdus histidinilytica]|uniref:Transferase hexapeptide (Six repeat-containing protein) n=1 Tax=Rhizorhabdus histidinilytica TaxID=439228 RepID=A0A1T5DG81_9SPHN|nr:acyltransferase [Rhizorhabdus histidinilytica]SKB70581.1 transferase hexapeptide (six repeat-containing protein) [Rhizorhabdus histidinilytica]
MSRLLRKFWFRVYLAASWFDGRLFRAIRKRALEGATGRKCRGLFIDPTVRITGVDNLMLGTNVSLHYWSYFGAEGGLSIGNDVAIGHFANILTTSHKFTDPIRPIKEQPLIFQPVTIGDNVWIGSNVTILAGVEIGPRTVIAAGAVVRHSFPEGRVVIGGVPARILKAL